MSSLCDRCFEPGACCKRLPLVSGAGHLTVPVGTDPMDTLRARSRDGVLADILEPLEPFGPVFGSPFDDERPEQAWLWRCKMLAPDGRCSIYEDRPEMCRVYEPASDRLCVHYGGAEGGEG